MTPHWTRDLCIWHYTGWRNVGLVICASDIVQNDAMLDSWSVHLTLYRMTPCWTRDLCIWHCTEWRHVGLVICVSDIYRMMPCWTHVGSWSVYLTFTEWLHVGLMICVSDIIQNGFMLDSWSVSDIIHDDAMLDSWPMYLTLYRIMLDSWSVYMTLYMMTQCWTRDLCIWHYTWWRNVGLVICVSDIIHDDAMLDSWSVYQALYRMMLDSWSVYLTLYRMDPCWTCDLCIWHYTEWLHVGLVIVYLTLYRMMPCWTNDLFI